MNRRQSHHRQEGRRNLRVEAPAKLNLDLFVGPPASDGYHPIDSIAAKVSICDVVEIRLRKDESLNFSSRGMDCGQDKDNLALLAAHAIKEKAGAAGADITLYKQMPPGSGLGGGSSDAAAVLKWLNDVWNLNLPASNLCEIGAGLGADVPFFLGPAAARMTGRGGIIEEVEVHPFAAVVYLPQLRCVTKDVYNAFDSIGKPGRKRKYDVELFRRPPSQWRGQLVNDLQAPAECIYPQLKKARQKLSAALEMPVCQTGSGSGLFVLCDDRAEAERVAASAPPEIGRRCTIVHSK